jgi:hypothetical protein
LQVPDSVYFEFLTRLSFCIFGKGRTMNQVVKFALLFLIMVGSVAARRPVVHDLFLAEDTSKEADAINKMNDYLQGIGADMEKRYSVGSVLQKHKLQDDYINLLEEGGRATALALAKGNREHETIVRESISNVEKLTQLIGAIGVVIGDNTKVEVQAGLSLGALGGGVSVGFAIKLGVIPDLLAVVNNFISLHYEETEDSTASMRFMHQLKQKLEEKAECKDVAKLLKDVEIGFSVGVDVSLIRGLAAILPKVGFSFGIPTPLYLKGPACMSTLGIDGLRYLGGHHPSYAEYAEAGAQLLTKMNEGTKFASKGLAEIFGDDNGRVDFSLGLAISIPEGLGIGYGVSLGCTKRPNVKGNVATHCKDVSIEKLNAFKTALFGGRRRRLLALTKEAEARSAILEDASSSHYDKIKAISSQATESFHRLTMALSSAATTDTSLIETLRAERDGQKTIVLGSMLIYGLMEGSDFNRDTRTEAERKRQELRSGLNGAGGKVNGVENIGEVVSNQFAESHGRNDECMSGISVSLKLSDIGISFGYNRGPLRNCFISLCKSIIKSLGYNDMKRCNRFFGDDNPLTKAPKEMEKLGGVNPDTDISEVFRWRTQKEETPFEKAAPWSPEIDVKWTVKPWEPHWTAYHRVVDLEGSDEDEWAHRFCIQFRVPRDHSVHITVQGDNDDLCKLQGAWGKELRKPDSSPYVFRDWDETFSDQQEKEDFWEIWTDTEKRTFSVGPINGPAGSPSKVHDFVDAGDKVTSQCGVSDNYYMCFANCNDYSSASVKFRFTKVHERGKCGLGPFASTISHGEQVLLFGGKHRNLNMFEGKAGKGYTVKEKREFERAVKQALEQDGKTLPIANWNGYEVVEKAGAGKDPSCCSNYCDGEFCANKEGFAPSKSTGTCQKSREDFQLLWEDAKAKMSKCYEVQTSGNADLDKVTDKAMFHLRQNKLSKLKGLARLKMAVKATQLKRRNSYKRESVARDGSMETEEVSCSPESIREYKEEIAQYAELMTSVKKIGCGARWKAVMKNPKAGFDVDTLPKEKWYKIALLAEPTPEDKENRGRLGRCQHGKELSIGIEDRCKGDWKEIRIPAKRAMIERASIDDGISPDWVTKDFNSFKPSSYGESWSTQTTTLSSGRVVSYGWNPNSPKDAP